MRLIQRAEFGWGPTGARSASPTRGLVIHYDGDDQGLAAKPHSACVAYWRRTRGFHMGPARGWADIGYSFGACPHGEVFEGRGLGHEQAAQPGGNSTWYSVTLMSGPSERPTEAQIDAVRQLRAWLRSKGVGSEVRGHRDFFTTSCPGDLLYGLVRDGTFTRPASPEEWPGRLLKYPPVMRGDDVRAWQTQMKKLGFTIAVDGAYGPGSRTVCRAFQRREGLEDDGIVGRATWTAAFAEPDGDET